jgi:cytochrome d ubiquinol oxidase subunit I
MVGGGILLGAFFFLYFVAWALKKRPYESKLFLASLVVLSFVSMLVYQLGWATDELGRQPWIIYNVMTVSKAANTVSSLFIPGILIIAFYLILIPATFYFFARVFNTKPVGEEMKEGQAVGGGVNY